MTVIRRDLGTPVTTGPAPDAGSRVDHAPLDLPAIARWNRLQLRARFAYSNRDHEMAIEMRRREQWALAADARNGVTS